MYLIYDLILNSLTARPYSAFILVPYSLYSYMCKSTDFMFCVGVVGWCEGVMYLMSPGRPADIGLQLGKACYACSG